RARPAAGLHHPEWRGDAPAQRGRSALARLGRLSRPHLGRYLADRRDLLPRREHHSVRQRHGLARLHPAPLLSPPPHDSAATTQRPPSWVPSTQKKTREWEASVMSTLRASSSGVQGAKFREGKAEVMRRSGHINPSERDRPEDAKQIRHQFTRLDSDQWAQAW